VAGEFGRPALLWYITDSVHGGVEQDSSVQSGRLCFLWWRDLENGSPAASPRCAEFLRECFPKDSVFFVHASSWTSVVDRVVDWRVAAVAPRAVDALAWRRMWEQVEEVITVGNRFAGKDVQVVEHGGEEVALQEHAIWFDANWGGVKTGSFGAVKQAVKGV
jgi:hypothetical protein